QGIRGSLMPVTLRSSLGRNVVVVAIVGLLCCSCIYARILYFRFPDLHAPESFDNRLVPASVHAKPLALRSPQAEFHWPASKSTTYRTFDDLLKENKTGAFLVVQHDEIVYERYFEDIAVTTRLPSFSISKTFASLLVSAAIEDGLIELDRSIV